MLKAVCTFGLVLVIVGPALSAVRSLPSYITPCRRSDPEINNCIKEHGNEIIPKLKDGDRKFRLPPANPLRIDEAIIQPGSNLKLVLRNIDVLGLDKLQIADAQINFEDHTLKMILDTPQIQVLGDYEIDGRILILPIVGKGKTNITDDNLHVTYNLKFAEEVINGIKQFKVIENSVDYTTSRVYYYFGNLFNGEPRLVAEMNKFLDENWMEIDKEFHGSFNEIVASIIKSFMIQVAQDIPYDSFFLP